MRSPPSAAATTPTSSPRASPARPSASSTWRPASTTRAREVYQRLGIPTVATVRWTADQMLQLPAAAGLGAEPSPTRAARVVIAEVPLARAWVGRRLTEVESSDRVRGSPIVTRFGEGMLPRPDTVFQDGDQVHVVAATDDLGRIEQVYDQPPPAH